MRFGLELCIGLEVSTGEEDLPSIYGPAIRGAVARGPARLEAREDSLEKTRGTELDNRTGKQLNSSLDVKLRVDVNIVDRLCEELIKRCSTCVRVSLVTYSSLSIYHESRTEDNFVEIWGFGHPGRALNHSAKKRN